MNQIIIKIIDDKKEKSQSFQAIAYFDYSWNNSWLGCGGEITMTAFGSTEKEARERLLEELFTYQSEFVKAISSLVKEIIKPKK